MTANEVAREILRSIGFSNIDEQGQNTVAVAAIIETDRIDLKEELATARAMYTGTLDHAEEISRRHAALAASQAEVAVLRETLADVRQQLREECDEHDRLDAEVSRLTGELAEMTERERIAWAEIHVQAARNQRLVEDNVNGTSSMNRKLCADRDRLEAEAVTAAASLERARLLLQQAGNVEDDNYMHDWHLRRHDFLAETAPPTPIPIATPGTEPAKPVPMEAEWDGSDGGHKYPPQGTSDCAYGCGCWAGAFSSGGPDGLDPLNGNCPKNPLNATPGTPTEEET